MSTDRTDFLREYYRLLTDDIRRAEDIVPAACGLEAIVLVLLLAVRWWRGPQYFSASIALVLSTCVMHLLLNANLRASRSHLMATNVEQEFFLASDMDVLLPYSYYTATNVYRYRRVFRAPFFLSLIAFGIALASFPLAQDSRLLVTLGGCAVLLASVYFEDRKCKKEYNYLVTHARGKLRSGQH
jgi:hypothetical protein